MRLLGLIFLCAVSVCFAGSRCPDPRLREATIGGDTVDAMVDLHHKPVAGAQVRLYASSGKTAWAGVTDKKGKFTIKNLAQDVYRLDVRGWGSTTIHLSPELGVNGMNQRPYFYLQLTDNECVSYSEVVN
jgi:Carboxypeptidase regulatory-like domain